MQKKKLIKKKKLLIRSKQQLIGLLGGIASGIVAM
jgi:hypothetical protein